jgi:hypothetical protein
VSNNSNTGNNSIDENLVSYCGLYCGLCKKYSKGVCQGCRKKEAPKWCEVKPCNEKKELKSCAECNDFPNVRKCKKMYPFKYKFGECIAQMTRKGGLDMIKEKSYKEFAECMVKENQFLCMKRKYLKYHTHKQVTK